MPFAYAFKGLRALLRLKDDYDKRKNLHHLRKVPCARTRNRQIRGMSHIMSLGGGMRKQEISE
jgi:hypothetical protein